MSWFLYLHNSLKQQHKHHIYIYLTINKNTLQKIKEKHNMSDVILTYIIPLVIMILTALELIYLLIIYDRDVEKHALCQRYFWFHVLGPMFLLGYINMVVLHQGGVICIADLHTKISDFWESVRCGFPTSISIFTTIFGLFVIYYMLYPRLQIYPLAAYERFGGKEWLTFLVRNIGYWETNDIRSTLLVSTKEVNGDKKIERLSLDITNNLAILDWRFDHENRNSVLIETKSRDPEGREDNTGTFDPHEAKKKNQRLELYVKVIHPLSRVSKVFRKEFALSDIHYGSFKSCSLERNHKDYDQKHPIKERLFKEKMWSVSNYIERFKKWLLIAAFIFMVIYISFFKEMKTVDIFYWIYYVLSVLLIVLEGILQLCRRPIQCAQCESSL